MYLKRKWMTVFQRSGPHATEVMRRRPLPLFFSSALIVGVLVGLAPALLATTSVSGWYAFPTEPPPLEDTMTPYTQPAPLEIGSYDVLGTVISAAEAAELLQTEEGQRQLSREEGAIEITEELIALGREAFYLETFGNEVFLTDVVGILDGPVNLWSVSRAILALRGQHTTNLQIPIDEDVIIGGRTFPAGSVLNTGLDVPPGSLLPLGLRLHLTWGGPKVGFTCALCHATVDEETGLIIEGATNIDVDAGLLLAMAPNTTAFFRNTDVDPTTFPLGSHTYADAEGELHYLPDPQAIEDAVDAALLSWPPGMFNTTIDQRNNPTFVPSAYTFGQFPYSWNGFGAIGWFQGLTTLNNQVHAVSSDTTSDAYLAPKLLDMDSEHYLGLLLQNAARPNFRLPEGQRPSAFLEAVTPTPQVPGIIELVPLPGYPFGSFFSPPATVVSRWGMPVGEHVNAMSAFQHTLAPPPNQPTEDLAQLEQGATVFVEAGCADCHGGRHFSNNQVIPLEEIGTQPLRALALKGMAEDFVEPATYPPSLLALPPPEAPVLPVPIRAEEQANLDLAYALDENEEGGYKVVTLIGVYLHAPYLHDGGVAAGPDALQESEDGFVVADSEQLGMAGTLMRQIRPDPEASLRVLVDRELRAVMVEANRAHPDLQRSNIEGIGHEFWVDAEAGFSIEEQTSLILFLLSLDDDPAVLPPTNQE
jgi:hypothetical protein